MFKLHSQWKVVHGHEHNVNNEADDDPQVEERAHDEGVDSLFEPPPAAAAVPLQKEVGQGGATWTTWLLVSRPWNTQRAVRT